MHVACSRRGYQLRLQSWELGLRPRYVSAASRPSPLLQRHMPCFFVFTDRDEAYPSRGCRHPPSVAALAIPKHEACTSRVRSGLQGPSGWPVAVSRTTASVAFWILSVQRQRTMIHREHAYDPSVGCLVLMAWPASRSAVGGGY